MNTPSVLSDTEITEILDNSYFGELDLKSLIQPASLDIPLGTKGWQATAAPNLSGGFNFKKYQRLLCNEFSLENKTQTIFTGPEITIIEALPNFRLPEGITAYANPKSSTGRLDIHTVLLAEGSDRLNVLPAGFKGKVYILISPQSFPITLTANETMCQLRFYKGDRQFLTTKELKELHLNNPIISEQECVIEENALTVHLDLQNSPTNLVSKERYESINLRSRGEIDPERFFMEKSLGSMGELYLEPGQFMLARTIEHLRIMPEICAEMVPFNDPFGEFRTHYAGFFDPGFGYGKKGEVPGTSAVCEIRNIGPYAIEFSHGQAIAQFRYEYLSQTPVQVYGDTSAKEASHYQRSNSLVSKHFIR